MVDCAVSPLILYLTLDLALAVQTTLGDSRPVQYSDLVSKKYWKLFKQSRRIKAKPRKARMPVVGIEVRMQVALSLLSFGRITLRYFGAGIYALR